MALGQSARGSFKRDLIVGFGLLALSKGEPLDAVRRVQKKLWRHNIPKLKEIIKTMKKLRCW